MSNPTESWPDEVYEPDEWPEVIRKPDAIYFTGGPLFVDGRYIGECGELEAILQPLRPQEEE